MEGFDAIRAAFAALNGAGMKLAGALASADGWLWGLLGICCGIEFCCLCLELIASSGGAEVVIEKAVKIAVRFTFVAAAITNWGVVSSGFVDGTNELTLKLTGIDGKNLGDAALTKTANIIKTAQQLSVFENVKREPAAAGMNRAFGDPSTPGY